MGTKSKGFIHSFSHESQCKQIGYKNIEEFIIDVTNHIDKIFVRDKGNGNQSYTIVRLKRNAGDTNGVVAITLNLQSDGNGGYYAVISAMPKRDKSLIKGTKKELLVYSNSAIAVTTNSGIDAVSIQGIDKSGDTQGILPTSDKPKVPASTIDEPSKKVNGNGAEKDSEDKKSNEERDMADRILDFYTRDLITVDEAIERLNDEFIKITNSVKINSLKFEPYSRLTTIAAKITRMEYAKKHKPKAESTLKSHEEERTDEEIKQDKRALKELGEETYNKVYRQAVYVLRKDEATRKSAFESALIFSKMSQSFKKNYGIDAPLPFLSIKKPKIKKDYVILGTYSSRDNTLTISKGYNNLSTLLHEGVHWYEKMMQQFASLSDSEVDTYFKGNVEEANKSIAKIREDLKVIDEWTKFSGKKLNDYAGTELEKEFAEYVGEIYSGDTKTSLQGHMKFRSERLARGFEQYILDGKANSKGLKKDI